MGYVVKDAELQTMTPRERKEALSALVAAARQPRNGQATEIDARIRAYESRYGMSSDELLCRLAKDAQKETSEIAEWLFWLNVRDRGADGKART